MHSRLNRPKITNYFFAMDKNETPDECHNET